MRSSGSQRRQTPSSLTALAAALFLLAPSHKAGAGDLALGEYLSSECVTCHQLSGHSTGGIPSIVGMPATHLAEALMAYKSGARNNEVMRNIAIRLSDDDIAALAAFFAEKRIE